MSDLAAFLNARLDEIQNVAQAVDCDAEPKSHTPVFTSLAYPTGTVEMSPARVLADLASKRAIVALHGPEQGGDMCDEWERWPCSTIRHLASPYADHPDFDEAWRV